jgi:hypothetical protein
MEPSSKTTARRRDARADRRRTTARDAPTRDGASKRRVERGDGARARGDANEDANEDAPATAAAAATTTTTRR